MNKVESNTQKLPKDLLHLDLSHDVKECLNRLREETQQVKNEVVCFSYHAIHDNVSDDTLFR